MKIFKGKIKKDENDGKWVCDICANGKKIDNPYEHAKTHKSANLVQFDKTLKAHHEETQKLTKDAKKAGKSKDLQLPPLPHYPSMSVRFSFVNKDGTVDPKKRKQY